MGTGTLRRNANNSRNTLFRNLPSDWTSLRLTWEPRILSILRIMTGLLFLQTGLNKLFNFPATPTHVPYQFSSLFSSLSPGVQGPIEVVGGLLIVFGLLYLYNNLHVAHHLKPTMAWYDIPGFYRDNRVELLENNAHFVYKGYGELARRYLFVPVFSPVHPIL